MVKGVHRLLANSRFWILALAVTSSVLIAGVVQLFIPEGSLQTIRIEQIYGFVALALLYISVIMSPFFKVFPGFKAKEAIVYSRRATGVSAFYFAALHVYITFFDQLGGFAGFAYLQPVFMVAVVLGLFALAVLFILTITSLDWAVKIMGFKNWKLLHRLIYLASLAILLHVFLIGTHFFNGLTAIGAITYSAAVLLIGLEIARIVIVIKNQKPTKRPSTND